MLRSRGRLLLATAGVLCAGAALLVPPAAEACSICGCDPSGGTLGLERPAAGEARVSLEARRAQGPDGE